MRNRSIKRSSCCLQMTNSFFWTLKTVRLTMGLINRGRGGDARCIHRKSCKPLMKVKLTCRIYRPYILLTIYWTETFAMVQKSWTLFVDKKVFTIYEQFKVKSLHKQLLWGSWKTCDTLQGVSHHKALEADFYWKRKNEPGGYPLPRCRRLVFSTRFGSRS